MFVPFYYLLMIAIAVGGGGKILYNVGVTASYNHGYKIGYASGGTNAQTRFENEQLTLAENAKLKAEHETAQRDQAAKLEREAHKAELVALKAQAQELEKTFKARLASKSKNAKFWTLETVTVLNK